ncbi:alkaline phosphatase family protein [soil metagenome]
MNKMLFLISLVAASMVVSCGASNGGNNPVDSGGDGGDTDAGTTGSADGGPVGEGGGNAIQRVYVVMMENNGASSVYGNTADCPYINNTLMATYGYAGAATANHSNYTDDVASTTPSEPHYIWIEAGTNVLSDHTFATDADPSAGNSSTSTKHLATLMKTANITWMSYQEGLDSTTGACPLSNDAAMASSFAVRHQPFSYFTDVSGLSKTNAYCIAHTKPYSALAADLASNAVAQYNFITPNLCHDMHVQGCGTQTASQKRQAGDTWLANNLPALISDVSDHHGIIFIAWDEPEGGNDAPFLIVGPNLKSAGYKSTVAYTHTSITKSVQQIFKLTPADGVAWLGHAGDPGVNDFTDFFKPASFP